MKIVVAMDSFKGSLTAAEACEAVRRGLLRALPDADVVLRPMADGGEGTAMTLRSARGGEWVPVRVTGPLPDMRVQAGYVRLTHTSGALVEMASASGLELLRADQLDPLTATTYGTGELIAHTLGRGARRLWLAIGGSATVDGGTGAATALGWRFRDHRGKDAGLGGRALERIAHVEPPPGPTPAVSVDVLCDVDNPLLGPRGAARVFGPQKGATPAVVDRLEAGLANLADVVERDLGRDVRSLPGAGAAGGLGAGAVAFLGARLVRGVEAVMDAVGLEEAIEDADWVMTGEGRYDEQSFGGKVVSGVVGRARAVGCRVAIVVGQTALTADVGGVDVMEIASPPDLPLVEALGRGEELIARAAERVAREHLR